MMLQRVAIDDHLPEHDPSGATWGAVRALDAVRRVAVALDQIVNRAAADTARWGQPEPLDTPANAGDLAEAGRQLRILGVAVAVSQSMIDGIEAQSRPQPPAGKRPTARTQPDPGPT